MANRFFENTVLHSKTMEPDRYSSDIRRQRQTSAQQMPEFCQLLMRKYHFNNNDRSSPSTSSDKWSMDKPVPNDMNYNFKCEGISPCRLFCRQVSKGKGEKKQRDG
ncbi:hypothetical protein CEXT_427821 [Caerostris extrusa]|uniref:Uncharacterized protein n=1 Tax=Caerostris extrusa TaxID=172846 RepID=A0AAV4XCV4_CAEEX|nr:hypothetical protein CEXT_427821 [Caerostris extrusa]